MAPMLNLAVWIGAVPVFPRQVLNASFSAVSARLALLVQACLLRIQTGACLRVAACARPLGGWLRLYDEERLHQSHRYCTRAMPVDMWTIGLRRPAPPPPLPEQARKAGKCSPSPTYPQTPQPTKDSILLNQECNRWTSQRNN